MQSVKREKIPQLYSNENESEIARAEPSGEGGRLGWRGLVAAVAFYTLLTALMTWPLLLNFTNAVPLGDIEDRYQNFWNFWWVKSALEHLQNPYLTNVLYYPYYTGPGPLSQGNNLSLYFHTLQLLNCLLVLPLMLIGGVAAAYNGLVFGSFVASGVGAFLLARYLVRNTPAALLAGIIYAFSGIRFEVIHGSWTNILATQWLPFYILALHCWRERRQKRYLVGAILCLVACAYTDWYNTTYLLLYTAFFLVVVMPGKVHRQSNVSPGEVGQSKVHWRSNVSQGRGFVGGLLLGWWQQVKVLLPVGIGALVLVAPLVIPSILELKNPLFVTVYGLEKDYRDSTLLAELVSPFKPHGVALWLGLIMVSVALLWRRRRAPWRPMLYWLIFGLGCFVLALGPKLQWERVRGSEPGGPYLPYYYLFKKLPAAQVMHSPDRFEIPGSLGLALALGFALAAIVSSSRFQVPSLGEGVQSSKFKVQSLGEESRNKKLETRNLKFKIQNSKFKILISWLGLVVLGGMALGAVNEAPLTMAPLERYAFLGSLPKDRANYYLLELPITRHNNFDYPRMYNQTIHQRPITGGYISRPILDPYRDPASPFNYLAAQAYVYGDPNKEIFPAEYSLGLLDQVIKLSHFDYVVVYKADYKQPQEISGVRALLDSRLGKNSLVQEDERTLLYKTPPEFWQKRSGPGLALGEGWYGVEKNEAGLYRWTQPSADFYLTLEQSGSVKLRIDLAAFGGDQEARLLLEGREVFRGRITPEAKPIELEFQGQAGTNRLRLESLSPAATPRELGLGNDTRRLAFLVQKLAIEEKN